jgi:(p)ppGpp synthase/HD superfamily hydrolase
MLYTELTNKAMRIAYAAHHGQVDKCGIPYIFHPIALAQTMDDEVSCCAALLHDVVEDTAITMEELEKEFPPEVIEVLRLLTHDDGEEYYAYVRRIKAHPIARKVKLADLAHNSDQSRCVGSGIPQETLDRWQEKYDKARKILTE